MRDDRLKWDAPEVVKTSFVAEKVTVTPVLLERQTLISGANVLKQIAQPVIEWPQITPEKSYALSLRRDQVLLVNGPEMTDGWSEVTQQSISDASDTWAVFDLSGPGAITLLNCGTELSLNVQSRSVSRLAFGLEVLIYRIIDHDRFRIHVASSQADTLLKHLTKTR